VRWRLSDLPQFIRFAIVGCIGFGVDVGVLYFVLYELDFGHYSGRVISYLAAATATWFLNRNFTFMHARSENRSREWARFVVLNTIGGMVNYLVYSVYISLHGMSMSAPAIGVAAGSLAGMIVNFLVSKHFAFIKEPTAPEESGEVRR
jgi:putative flippase GtrA